MRFVFEMARREMRASWRRLLFFFVCIAIGVGSIVILRSMIQNINQAVTGEARSLLTADVQVDSDRPWTPEMLASIDRIAQPLIRARNRDHRIGYDGETGRFESRRLVDDRAEGSRIGLSLLWRLQVGRRRVVRPFANRKQWSDCGAFTSGAPEPSGRGRDKDWRVHLPDSRSD